MVIGGMNGPLETKSTLHETVDIFTEGAWMLGPKFTGGYNEQSSGTSGGVGIGFNGGGAYDKI